MRRSSHLLLLVCLLALAACGPLPRPFQPSDKTDADLAALSEQVDVLVVPIAQNPPGDPEGAAEAMAAALRDQDIAAAVNGRVAAYILTGRAAVLAVAPDRDEVTIAWELRETGGQRIAVHAQRSELPRGFWHNGENGAVAKAMAEGAGAIGALVPRPNMIAGQAASMPQPRLVILPLEEVPGNGGRLLPIALEAELRAANFDVVNDIGEHDILILGDVRLDEVEPGWQDVSITWSVVRARDGHELGEIGQDNRVPAGSLDGAWGPAAFAIARGAAEGILQILARQEPS